ncbi:hypothetical protein P3T76_004274 [Phytophthora citrophthora]|uniref:Uncharacterized protein n=1 Tax=Phytophthora citrophthora TaxID=4793 RepID=A0AAD9LR73_9STRA|nr:hypothetical protein P3T76_004274 [Phytophthora citrophthora]
MLVAGRAQPTTEKITKQFQTEQLDMWLNSGQSVDDVYKLLNFPIPRSFVAGFGGEKLLDTWVAYMNIVSIKNPDEVSAMISTLTTSFRDNPMNANSRNSQ